MKKIISIFSVVFVFVFIISSVIYADSMCRPYPPNTKANISYSGPYPIENYPKSFNYPYDKYGFNYWGNSGCWQDFWPKPVTILEKGWHTDSQGKYYCKGDGSVFRNGWYWIDGKRYKFDYNGYVCRNQWIKDYKTGSWYFVDTDGATVTGWKHIDNVWYYFNPEVSDLYGVMARNTVMYINDYTFGCGFFAFNNEGAVITNSWYGGHYYGSNGVRVD